MANISEQVAEARQRLVAIRQIGKVVPRVTRPNKGVEDLDKNGVVAVDGKVYLITARHTYRDSENFTWFELMLQDALNGEVRYLEVERDDELEVTFGRVIGSTKHVSGANRAITEIDDLDDDEDGDGIAVSFEGTKYEYDDDEPVTFFRNGKEAGEKFYCYDFEAKDGKHFLSIEKWGAEYEVSVGRAITPAQVEVISVGNDDEEEK